MSRRQITLSEIVQAYGESIKSTMYHTLPGVVKAYYASDGTADVQPAVNDVRFDPDTDERVSEAFPIIPKVKIKYPGGGGFSITFPLQAGDKVTLLAYDLDPTVHQATGNVEDPQDVRRHGGTYWLCMPGDLTDAAPVPTAGQITIDGPGITLGKGATDFVALASLVKTELTSIKNALAGLQCPNNGSGPIAVTSSAPYSTVNDVKSAIVQSK